MSSARLHTRVVGDGQVPVAFLHGLFGQGKNWTSIAQALPEATSLLIDAPNHGHSPWTERFDYDESAEMVAKELAATPRFADGCVLVGHSMGGKTAMRLGLAHPELVTALVVVDISPIAGTVGRQFPELVAAMRGLDLRAVTSRAAAGRALADKIPDSAMRGFLLQNLHLDQTARPPWSWRMNLAMLGDALDQIGDWSPSEAVYRSPVLWLAGDESNYVRPEHRPAMAASFPTAVQVRVRGAGHWVHYDQPERFLDALRSFLRINRIFASPDDH